MLQFAEWRNEYFFSMWEGETRDREKSVVDAPILIRGIQVPTQCSKEASLSPA